MLAFSLRRSTIGRKTSVPLLLITCLAASCTQGVETSQRGDSGCMFQPGSPTSCTRIYACIGGEDILAGRAVGWEEGVVAATMSNGATCEGTFQATRQGGTVSFTCDDGQSAGVNFTLAGNRSSTAIGIGRTDQGRTIQGWTGPALREYFSNTDGGQLPTCGGQSIQPV